MKAVPIILAVVTFFLSVAASDALAGQLIQRNLPAGDALHSRDRSYQVYVPDGLPAGRPVPMVMVLHGCKQTEENMITETRFRELADRDGFIVVYPFITSYDGLRNPNCWGFWFPHHRKEGKGEPGDLHRLAVAVEAEFPIDPARRYITGLSSGGAMSVAMAVLYSEYFAAAGAVAGLPYAENAAAVAFSCFGSPSLRPLPSLVDAMEAEQEQAAEQRVVPMMVIQSEHDCTVRIENGENIRDVWIARYGADEDPLLVSNCTRENIACQRLVYERPDGQIVVESVFYVGETQFDTHYWPGDHDGEFANSQGPSASDLLWAHFQRHVLAPGDMPPADPPGEGPVDTLPLRVETGDWQAHLLAGRIKLQAAPCAVRTLGACDADFTALFTAHGFDPFDLHSADGSGLWYADPANMPAQ